MAITPTIGTSRIAVTAVEGETTLDPGTRKIWLKNVGPNTAYLDTITGVTDLTGFPIEINDLIGPIEISPRTGMSIFLICAAAETASLGLLQEG